MFYFFIPKLCKKFFEQYRNKNKDEKKNVFNSLGIKNKLLVKFKDINKTFQKFREEI